MTQYYFVPWEFDAEPDMEEVKPHFYSQAREVAAGGKVQGLILEKEWNPPRASWIVSGSFEVFA